MAGVLVAVGFALGVLYSLLGFVGVQICKGPPFPQTKALDIQHSCLIL
jgi:hypothetical protein